MRGFDVTLQLVVDQGEADTRGPLLADDLAVLDGQVQIDALGGSRSVGLQSTLHDIAAAFLARDTSQIEYYEQITKEMPGKVLAKHGLVEREGRQYRLTLDPATITSQQRDELIGLCDQKIDAYLQKRGGAVYAHRSIALGYIPGIFHVIRPKHSP